jgi:Anti-sigma-K factor rskA, C-terminal
VQHVDPDQLALLALGEPVDPGQPDQTAHLAACPACQHELHSLRETVELTRETVSHRDTEAVRPPEAVWHGIEAELGLRGAPGLPGSGRKPEGGVDWFEPPQLRPGPGDLGPPPTDPETGRGLHRLEGVRGALPPAAPTEPPGPPGPAGLGVPAGPAAVRARRRWAKAAVALVAAAAVGVLGTLAVVQPWTDAAGRPPAASSIASLQAVAGGPTGVTGSAEVLEVDGGRELHVTTSGLPRQPGFYQVWVFDGRDRMQAVGVLGRDSATTVALPTTLDLDVFNVVDISLEPYDGDQTHSTTSVLRGTLTT